jgi:integrase
VIQTRSYRKKKAFRLRVEAERWEAVERARLVTGGAVVDERLSVGDVYARWVDWVRDNKAHKYWMRCRTAWLPLRWILSNGGQYVTRLNLQVLDRYIKQRRAAGLAAQTVHNECRSLVACLNWARSRGIVAENPLAAYKPAARIEHVVPEVPTPAELQRIFDHLPDDDTRKALYGLLALGCRVGAFRALRAEHITATGMLNFVDEVKGGQSYRRTLPAFPFELPTKGWLFARHGEQWREEVLLRRLHKACAAARVAKINLHTCRHAAVTYLLAGGVPSATVMGMTGHRTLQMIERYLDRSKEYGGLLDKTRGDGYLPKFRDCE